MPKKILHFWKHTKEKFVRQKICNKAEVYMNIPVISEKAAVFITKKLTAVREKEQENKKRQSRKNKKK